MSLFKISYIQIIFICASLPLKDNNHSCHHFYRHKIFCLDYLFSYIIDNVYKLKILVKKKNKLKCNVRLY